LVICMEQSSYASLGACLTLQGYLQQPNCEKKNFVENCGIQLLALKTGP
jgi:hypothetical protein